MQLVLDFNLAKFTYDAASGLVAPTVEAPKPVSIDEEFAKAVGLPGRILHGLWTMAQVARAQTEAAGGPETLRRLSVQFRGLGMLDCDRRVWGDSEKRCGGFRRAGDPVEGS